jgi:1-pyrroline-5-carboxylate dehydrogenase
MVTLTHPAREANRADENRNYITAPDVFVNEPMIDWTNPENLRRMQAALDKVRAELGREYDLVIGGRHVKTGDIAPSVNPAKPSEVVGLHHQAGPAQVEPAMEAALKAFETWSRTSLEERTQFLFRVGRLLQERKYELEAWLVFEVGKNFAEADGDVAELIDFCHLYAIEALRLGKATTVVQLPGEHDQFRYVPLGVGAVISPWNFPAAIMGGMTLASVVSGNTVVLKPSGDSPTIAAKFM